MTCGQKNASGEDCELEIWYKTAIISSCAQALSSCSPLSKLLPVSQRFAQVGLGLGALGSELRLDNVSRAA